MSDLALAAVLAGTILLASTVSVELGLSVALIELVGGVIVGNAFDVSVPAWLAFVGTFAGIVLTFQAGALPFGAKIELQAVAAAPDRAANLPSEPLRARPHFGATACTEYRPPGISAPPR